MFGIGMQELLLIFVVAMIVLGPKKLPELAKTLGRAAREFRKASTDLKQAIGLDDEHDAHIKSDAEISKKPATESDHGNEKSGLNEETKKEFRTTEGDEHAGC